MTQIRQLRHSNNILLQFWCFRRSSWWSRGGQLNLDKAPRLSIRIVIWILLSDTVFVNSTKISLTNSETAMLSNPIWWESWSRGLVTWAQTVLTQKYPASKLCEFISLGNCLTGSGCLVLNTSGKYYLDSQHTWVTLQMQDRLMDFHLSCISCISPPTAQQWH